MMIPPLVSFVTWNRMGLTARNLTDLLNTADDFELYITDNNSQDNTWSYIQSLSDKRIKSIKRFEKNAGPIYAVNYNLSKRKRDQYFIALDSDVNIHTPDWITRFVRTFDAFPQVGLLGAVTKEYYDMYRQPAVMRENGGFRYIEITRGFIEGCCQCFRPELLDVLGYWCEECCMGDMEICHRISNYTSYKSGFLPEIEIDQCQLIDCDSCKAKSFCNMNREEETCFTIRDEKYKNPQFRTMHGWKYRQCVRDLAKGQKTVYCASTHDKQSLQNCYYNRERAEENFRYYIRNSN